MTCGPDAPACVTGKYNKWDKVDPAELFSQAPTEKKEANPKLNMVKFLQVRPGLPGAHASPSRPAWAPRSLSPQTSLLL